MLLGVGSLLGDASPVDMFVEVCREGFAFLRVDLGGISQSRREPGVNICDT